MRRGLLSGGPKNSALNACSNVAQCPSPLPPSLPPSLLYTRPRAFGRLALVEVAVWPETLLQGSDLAAYPDACLVLRAPSMPELRVPLAPPPPAGRRLVPVTVWAWSGQAAGG